MKRTVKLVAFISIGLALVAGLAVGAPSNLSEEPEAASAAVTPVASSRASFQWPKLFDFENYKRQFHKHYGSLAENIVRNKIYLAKAFRVFIAAIKYRSRQMKYFLRINPRSDWTPRELMQGFLRLPGKLSEDKKETGEQAAQPADDTGVPERGGVKMSPDELDALERQTTSAGQRELPFSKLMSSPDAPSPPEQFGDLVPSNNPNYEPPIRSDIGAEAEQKADESEDAWSAEAAAKYQLAPGIQSALGVLPGYNYISSVVRNSLWELQLGLVGDSAYKELPDLVYLDHRDSGCITQPRDQLKCRSCYIFAYVALYEWLYCKLKGRPVKLSEQYIKDCGSRVGMEGCGGGSMVIVPSFVEKYGLELMSNYPYTENQGTCPYDNSTDPAKMGYLRLDTGPLAGENVESPNFVRLLALAPMAVGLFTTSDFDDYGGGVHTNTECIQSNGHAMLLIGHGREDGEEYWLIKNSHGVWFGEQGYYKISKKAACFSDNSGFMFLNSFHNTLAKKKNRNYDGEPVKRLHLQRLREEFVRQVEAEKAETAAAADQTAGHSQETTWEEDLERAG